MRGDAGQRLAALGLGGGRAVAPVVESVQGGVPMKDIEVHHDNLAKHGVTPEEAVECIRMGRRTYRRKVGPATYQVITQVASGRYLEVLYKELGDKQFVFHAMDARPRDIKLLRRRGKRR